MVQRRGAASYYMRDRIHVQNAKQNAVMSYDVCDFLSFPNFGTILFWPISLLIISSGSSGLFTFGCFNYVVLKIYHVTSLKKAHRNS